MEIRIANGDYIPDGLGGIIRCSDKEALLQRILYRLTARRGQFPFLPELGSRLYLLGREPGSKQLSAARTYVAEALAQEDVVVTDVSLLPADGGRFLITVSLQYQGDDLAVTLTA